jgi:uncharacterized membrane protein
MPAILIRQLDSLTKIMHHTHTADQRELLLSQARMIYAASEESVPEPADRDDVRRAYEEVLEASARLQEEPRGAALDLRASRSTRSAGRPR